jgi:hypothetical protein
MSKNGRKHIKVRLAFMAMLIACAMCSQTCFAAASTSLGYFATDSMIATEVTGKILEEKSHMPNKIIKKTTSEKVVKKSVKMMTKKKAKKFKNTKQKFVGKFYAWNNSRFQEIKVYKYTKYTKKKISKKKVKVTTKVIEKQVISEYKHFREEVDINAIIPKLPKNIRTAFIEGDNHIYINTRMSDNEIRHLGLDGTEDLGLRGLCWDNGTSNCIEVRFYETVYHEIGHFCDNYIGQMTGVYASDTEEFIEIYNKEAFKKNNPIQYDAETSPYEYYAEAMLEYFANPAKVKTNAPRTYNYIQKTINMI